MKPLIPPFPAPDPANGFLAWHLRLLRSSFSTLAGRELLVPDPGCGQDDATLARLLFEAPFALLSHDNAADPILTYANRTALTLFELDWQRLVAMPSRLTAQAPNQAERARLLERVAQKGLIDDYSGVRISATGRRFRIERATVWNLTDGDGRLLGQAAVFAAWQRID